MPNPYHDETGRFCSKNEMKQAIKRLSDSGEYHSAANLTHEFNKIEKTRQNRNILTRMLGREKLPEPEHLTGAGSETFLVRDIGSNEEGKTSLRRILTDYLSKDKPSYIKVDPQLAQTAQMFLVHAEEYKKDLIKNGSSYSYREMDTKKAIYRALLKQNVSFLNHFSEYGANSNAVPDSDIEEYFDKKIKTNERLDTSQAKINNIALRKMAELFDSSYDDMSWEEYPDKAESILVK